MAVDRNTAVIDAAEDLGAIPPWGGRGPQPTRPARVRSGEVKGVAVEAFAAARAGDFCRLSWREGSGGRMRGRFAARRMRPAPDLSARREPGPPCWPLAEWPEGDGRPTKFYFSNLPEHSAVRTPVRAVGTRWRTEQGYQQMKEEPGLDHFEGRSWRGFHHNMTLVMLAYAFLVALRDDAAKKGAHRAPPRHPGGPPADPGDPLALVGLVPDLRTGPQRADGPRLYLTE